MGARSDGRVANFHLVKYHILDDIPPEEKGLGLTPSFRQLPAWMRRKIGWRSFDSANTSRSYYSKGSKLASIPVRSEIRVFGNGESRD